MTSEQASQLLAAIVESSDDAIASKDLDGVISSWNQGAERLFGYTAEEAIGHSVTMLIPADHQDEEPRILERAAASASSTTRPFAGARTAASSTSRSPSRR
jgi:PAS domain S-box-containing protein